MSFRLAARVDSNQKEIVEALRAYGCSVLHLHQLKNCFDILVGYKGLTFLFEIKKSAKDKLTEGELKFKTEWFGSPVSVITSELQAIEIIEKELYYQRNLV